MSLTIQKCKNAFVLLLLATVLLSVIYMVTPIKRVIDFGYFRKTGSLLVKNWKPSLVSLCNFEELTRNDPVLKDWTKCADPKSSVISVQDKKDSYNIGDEVIVNITIKDFLGRNKSVGGDVVRILVKDKLNATATASIGYVIDNHDGTYTGVVKLLWAGNVTVEAQISTQRELVRLVYDKVRTGKIRRPMKGKFRQGSKYVFMNCTPLKAVANNYKTLCNLTHRNANLPWYCEKPDNYSCQQWTSNGYVILNVELTQQETELVKRAMKGIQITTGIDLRVINDTQSNKKVKKLYMQTAPCNKLPKKDTWTSRSPVGYLYRGTWYSLQCRNTFKGSLESFDRCLRGRKLWLIGDSNMRTMTSYFMNFLKLNLKTEKWTKKKWHKPSLASKKNGTISIFWGSHALPKYFMEAKVKGTHQYIDAIPANSKDIVVVHFYMHYLPFHPSVVRRHIRKTVESIKVLRSRAPEAKVLVRGSHAFFIPHEITHFNDFWGIVYDQMLKEEFSPIVDDVVFLDQWDLTVAGRNTIMHPPGNLMKQAVNYMMGFICP